MEDVKESVRQGVSKLGGRLSGMASGVMNQIQVGAGGLVPGMNIGGSIDTRS